MAPFWRVWGGSWASLGRSWAPCWRFLGALGRLFGLIGASDLIWGGVWEALGGFLGNFGEDFERILGRFWEDIFVSETPALPRQLAWRHNFDVKVCFLEVFRFRRSNL